MNPEVRPPQVDDYGIFQLAEAAQHLMKKAFTSDEFEADPDSFRHLAWTNARVRAVNEMIRRWRYGEEILTRRASPNELSESGREFYGMVRP
jgi:hypothetical protein